MPSFSFRIKSKIDKPVSIYVSFRPQNSPPVFSRTGLFTHPNEWSNSKKRAKPNSTQAKNLNYILNNKELHFIIKDLNDVTAEKFLDLSLYQLRHLRKIKAEKSKKTKKFKQNETKYKKTPPKSRLGDLN